MRKKKKILLPALIIILCSITLVLSLQWDRLAMLKLNILCAMQPASAQESIDFRDISALTARTREREQEVIVSFSNGITGSYLFCQRKDLSDSYLSQLESLPWKRESAEGTFNPQAPLPSWEEASIETIDLAGGKCCLRFTQKTTEETLGFACLREVTQATDQVSTRQLLSFYGITGYEQVHHFSISAWIGRGNGKTLVFGEGKGQKEHSSEIKYLYTIIAHGKKKKTSKRFYTPLKDVDSKFQNGQVRLVATTEQGRNLIYPLDFTVDFEKGLLYFQGNAYTVPGNQMKIIYSIMEKNYFYQQ